MLKQKEEPGFSLKEVSEIAAHIRGNTLTVIEAIKKNLKLELAFAVLFLLFNGVMFILFSQVFYLRLFTLVLVIFCLGFIYYIIKLLRYTRVQYSWDAPLKEQLSQYIIILSRFTLLYFKVTMVLVPLIFLLTFIAVSLDQSESGIVTMFSNPGIFWIYFGTAACWCCIMYFVSKWYIKKLYGNHIKKLKLLLQELVEE
jgi:Ca2+/Na+ antiporter